MKWLFCLKNLFLSFVADLSNITCEIRRFDWYILFDYVEAAGTW